MSSSVNIPSQVQAVCDLLNLDESDVYRHLGSIARSIDLRSAPDDQGDEDVGRKYYSRYLARLRGAICGDTTIRKMLSNDEHSVTVDLVPPVLDLVLSVVGGLTAASVTALALKVGINKLCAEDWAK